MSDDSRIQQAVLDELGYEPSIVAGHIGVMAKDGVVTLTGHVESFREKHSAEMAACRVRGVRAVAEEIEVRLPVETERSDEEIAAAAISRLDWNVLLPRHAIMVKVEKGWVTLSGAVHWQYQKEAAEEDVRGLFGVVGVSNQMRIETLVDASHVRENIMHALHRSRFFDPDQISVHAEGSTVYLTGRVDSPMDWRMAGAIAWAAPGATRVKNDIAII